jgi:periplasmic protein TonB
MSTEPHQVFDELLGSLQSCLVGGDPEQRLREGRVRRRALLISIAAQSVVVAAIVLIPLFAKPGRIALANVVPLPPYYAHAERRPADPSRPHAARAPQKVCRFCAPTSIPRTLVMPAPPPNDAQQTVDLGDVAVPAAVIPLVDERLGTKPPPPPRTEVEEHKIIHKTQIDPAMLTRRVEPIYPTLMRQIGRSGQVQLRAMIGIDGSIQSLQVVSGDPGFYQSALHAVRQWRYRPTVLNGAPVEVDTFITVIYNIAR